MSLECGICERDMRSGHDESCPRYDPRMVDCICDPLRDPDCPVHRHPHYEDFYGPKRRVSMNEQMSTRVAVFVLALMVTVPTTIALIIIPIIVPIVCLSMSWAIIIMLFKEIDQKDRPEGGPWW